ncbi:hypothetical protein BJF78_19985 [Pseudonocardia sp. CNS-139]|nr:hypothetical protein BJF78_19985 [Pseudonocardia sp. CNS-139]
MSVVYALLTSGAPRRLLSFYLVAGTVVSLATGIAVVSWFGAVAGSGGASAAGDVGYVVAGAGALSFAVGFWSGRVGNGPRRGERRGPLAPDGRLGRRLRNPSAVDAAVAGALTNLPGLFYLAGLAAILETRPTPVNAVAQVVVFNVLRFAAPLAVLVLLALRPDGTLRIVDTVHAWARRHSRKLVTGVFALVGGYLLAKGLVGLLA